MRKAFIPAMAIGAALSVAPALAQDNPSCAKFQEPLAYNACLARLGPPAHGTRAIPEPQGESEGPRGPAGPHMRDGLAMSHERHGRMRAEFEVTQPRSRRH